MSTYSSSMAVDKLPYRYYRVGEITSANPRQRLLGTGRFFYTILAISCIANIVFIVKFFDPLSEIPPETSHSPNAGLINDVPVPFKWGSEYSDINNPRLSELWQFDGIIDHGLVALTEAEVTSMSLLPSEQAFPWDPENKKMYAVNAHHGLHCLRLIYTSISAYRTSTPQKSSHAHIIHCLDNLRQDIICTADDSLRYLTNNGTHVGENQLRFCRDFSQLNSWAVEHDACFRQPHDLADEIALVEKYKYCKTPEYLPQVRQYFHLPSDWEPPEPSNQV